MQILIKLATLFFAITHLWVSGSLLLHKHEECNEKGKSHCHHQHEPSTDDECAICYYIHLPNSISTYVDFQLNYLPSYFYLPYDIAIDSRIISLVLLPNSNKGPPF